jgi:hypothetical protein
MMLVAYMTNEKSSLTVEHVAVLLMLWRMRYSMLAFQTLMKMPLKSSVISSAKHMIYFPNSLPPGPDDDDDWDEEEEAYK